MIDASAIFLTPRSPQNNTPPDSIVSEGVSTVNIFLNMCESAVPGTYSTEGIAITK